MPIHKDFKKVRRGMRDQYGREKGDRLYYSWLNKHGYDDSKPIGGQKSKASANDYEPFMELFDDLDEEEEERLARATADSNLAIAAVTKPEVTKNTDDTEQKQIALHDELDKLDKAAPEVAPAASAQPYPQQEDSKGPQPWNKPPTGGDQADPKPMGLGSATNVTAFEAAQFMSVPAFNIPYVATPKFESKDGPIIIKAIVLEEGENVNRWRVIPAEFPKVADQYKAGRQLRVNHGKDVQDVLGKSYEGKVIKGSEVAQYLGKEIEGIRAEGIYVVAEFEANPQDQQVRTNILEGYVNTGSIGLDANAFCEECDKPLQVADDGKMDRTCRHFDAPIKLRNVEVKEYSYVAEPAYAHTMAFPSFGAAVDSRMRESSLSDSKTPSSTSMTQAEQTKVEATAAAKKADSDSDSDAEGDADAIAAKYISYYKKGIADAQKFRADDGDFDDDDKKRSDAKADSDSDADASVKADSDSDSDADASAKASKSKLTPRKTDQQGRVAPTPKPVVKNDLLARVLTPSKVAMQDPAIRELFRAAASLAPAPIKGTLQENLKGRFE